MRKILCVVAAMFLFSCGGVSDESSITGTTALSEVCPTPTQLATDLSGAAQAAVLGLSGVNPLVCPEVSMSQTWSGGKLVFSDSPESPTVRGKLYEDGTLAATPTDTPNRVFVYHTNGKASGKMKFTVLVTNLGSSSASLTIRQKGLAGPAIDYVYTGKMALYRWLTSTAGSPVAVAAGATVRLDSALEVAASPAYLVHGIYDYTMTQNHRITVCALNEKDNALTVCPGLGLLARHPQHQRGTFPNADKIYDTASGIVVNTLDGISQFPLGGNTANDSDAVGTDVTDGSQQTLAGNFGVLYRMHMNLVSEDGRNFGILINPRGGLWGSSVWTAPGITPGGKFLIPPGTGSFADNTKGAVEGKYAPGGGLSIWVQFMPSGGVNLPVRFILTPY